MSAWPFVVVILTQMAVGGFSVYTLSTIRAFVSGESLWSKSQHEAVYFLSLYLDAKDPRIFQAYKRAIAVPLEYRQGRLDLESETPDPAAAHVHLSRAGIAAEDIPHLIWMFCNFRDFPYLRDAIANWTQTDPFILELDEIGTSVGAHYPADRVVGLRNRVEEVDAAITPRAIAFSRVLDEGARVVERMLLIVNVALAGLLALLTIWRVSRVLRQRRRFEDALAWQASHDELTSLVNRRAFEERLLEALTPTRSDPAAACALMFIDLDQFKIINDTCGHAAGDAMLRRIGPPLEELLGPDDLLARLGGDEFGILVQRTDMANALALAEKVRVAVENVDFAWNGRVFRVTASIGLAHARAGAVLLEEMMSEADMACFMAKEKGRNCVQIHRKEDQETRGRVTEMNWVHRIQQALAEDRFCLYAQEIVALADDGDEGIHLEVLIRNARRDRHARAALELPACRRTLRPDEAGRPLGRAARVPHAFRTTTDPERHADHPLRQSTCRASPSGTTPSSISSRRPSSNFVSRRRSSPSRSPRRPRSSTSMLCPVLHPRIESPRLYVRARRFRLGHVIVQLSEGASRRHAQDRRRFREKPSY